MKRIFWKYSIPMHLMIIPNSLGMATVPILSLFFAQKLIGYYAFAMIFYQGIFLIPMALSQVLFPKVSELDGKNDLNEAKSILKKVFVFYTPIVVIGIIGTLLFSKYIINLIAPAYLPGLLIFKALVCFCFLFGYLVIYRDYLSAMAEIKKLTLLLIIYNIAFLTVSFAIMGML